MSASARPRLPPSPDPQADLFASPGGLPDGFRYRADVLSPEEEAALARELGTLPFRPFDFQGFLANRRVVSFGFRYDYGSRAVVEAAPFPPFLVSLRRKVAALFDRPEDAFRQVLINEYRPGAGIGWHRDKAQFDEVVGVSLLAPCNLRFRRKSGEGWERASLHVEPRSAYLLSGPARSVCVGAQYSGPRPPSLFDHPANPRRLRRGTRTLRLVPREALKARLEGRSCRREAFETPRFARPSG